MKVIVPTLLIEKVIDRISIDHNLIDLKEKQQQKLIKRLIELWYFVYNKQISDGNALNLKFYTLIHKNELMKFQIKVCGLRLYYTDLLNILGSLIERNDDYSSGNFSYGYRVNTDFISFGRLTEYEVDFNLVFNNTNNKEYWIKKYPNLKNLIEDAYNTTIDLDEYLFWMQSNLGCKLNPVYNKKKNKIEDRILDNERLCHHFNLALKVNMKNLWFKLSDEGRFYSSISNLPKTSVNFIKLYNEKTISVDIANCQPLLLSTMIDNDEYKNDCLNGVFYDELERTLSGESSTSQINRQKVKLMCYKYIFFGSNTLSSGLLYSAMEKKYKGVINQINNIKMDKCLAKTLQQIESDIFVNKIGKIKIPKLLRHDEVIVSLSNLERIKEYLRKEFLNINIKLLIN
jgi:hypothetical protein